MQNRHVSRLIAPLLSALGISVSLGVAAQQPSQPPPAQPPASSRTTAPIDLTGYWVSVVTEDWRFRMVTPKKGDYASVPLNDAARKVADGWDAAKDEKEGNQCKAYGAANIMRVPGRVHVSWDGDETVKVETDAGQQTRMLYFDKAKQPGAERTWQGHSVAEWEGLPAPRGGGGGGGRGGAGFGGPGAGPGAGRSEERRVGKECRL